MRNCAIIIVILFSLILVSAAGSAEQAKTVFLDEMDLGKMTCGWRQPQANRSVEGNPIVINGKEYKRGVGTHAESMMIIDLNGRGKRFQAVTGLDGEVAGNEEAQVEFRVLNGKEEVLWSSGIIKEVSEVKKADVDISGVETLVLYVNDGGNSNTWDHADWADAKITYTGKKPSAKSRSEYLPSELYILTPSAPDEPQINGAKVYGVKPGRPFLYRIPATGKRPIEFAVEGLPEGLKVDRDKGIIVGKISQAGDYKVTFVAENDMGTDRMEFTIKVGDTIALTPPMGWNSWNCWGCSVTAEHIKETADAMVESGLVNYGWQYINIDDCWQGERDPETGLITSNEKFPDMAGLADYVHRKGLKIGLYTDAGTMTCQEYEGSEGNEYIDIMRYAEWGYDYVKVDWCFTHGMDPKKRYAIFGNAIKRAPRDIVFSICNWGQNEPWKWGKEVGGNSWRTTGDIVDTWGSMSGIGFGQAGLSEYAEPGHWNDPDMLVVGKVGWGPDLHETRLSPDEQYTHITLWSLLCSPLLLGNDISDMSDFTRSLLTNSEVIAVNQDRLGEQAERIVKDGKKEIWSKPLSDGSMAVGLFNRSLFRKQNITVDWDSLGITGKQQVRDLWRQKDLGVFEEEYEAKVRRHGVVFVKITPAE